MTTQDRVSYSHGVTVPGPEQYSSRRIDVSFTTDVRYDETPEQAMDRAKAFVHAQAEEGMPLAERPAAPASALTVASIDAELFDPANPVHRRIANAVLDTENVRSEKAREFKMTRLMKGMPIRDLAQIVRRDQEAFQANPGGSPRGKRWP